MLRHVPLILRNVVRNRRRSLLTVASVAVSLALLGTLLTIYQGLFDPQETSPAQARRLVTHHKVSLTQSMPAAYGPRIRQVAGVEAMTVWQWFGGTYKEPRNFFAQFGVDPKAVFKVRPDQVATPEVMTAFERQRTGAVVSRRLADRFGWKAGERITLLGQIYPTDLELTLVGTFDDPSGDEVLYYHAEYLEQAIPASRQGQVGAFLVLADDPSNVPAVAQAIDKLFANSPAPTKTETERDFALSFVAFLGNLKLFLAAVCGAVLFTVLLVSANTVAMAVRERTRETAILRTLGYRPEEILALVLGEAGLLGLIGGGIGAAMAAGLCYAASQGAMGGFRLPAMRAESVAIVVAVAVVVGVVSAIAPAVIASRRPIVESVRYAG